MTRNWFGIDQFFADLSCLAGKKWKHAKNWNIRKSLKIPQNFFYFFCYTFVACSYAANVIKTKVNFYISNFSLSPKYNQRLEIGSGTLVMGLDESLEERIKFWSSIWSRLPTNQRLNSSPTWSNSMLYKKVNKEQIPTGNEEL